MMKHDKAYFLLCEQQEALKNLQRAIRLADGVKQARDEFDAANAAMLVGQEEAKEEARRLTSSA